MVSFTVEGKKYFFLSVSCRDMANCYPGAACRFSYGTGDHDFTLQNVFHFQEIRLLVFGDEAVEEVPSCCDCNLLFLRFLVLTLIPGLFGKFIGFKFFQGLSIG